MAHSNKGITLIALVITIIVIIILASISVNYGMDLIYKSRTENFITNMLVIKSKARVYEEEVESKIWDFSDNIEEGANISKKEEGRRDHLKNDYHFILVNNENSSEYNMSNLQNDSVYYALEEAALEKMGLSSLWENKKSCYIVKYEVKDNKYEDIDIYYTKGIQYKGNTYYKLSELQNVIGE